MRILVVEDHRETRTTILGALREAGYPADGAENLRSARERLISSNYGIVVLDWMLPDGSGLDLCREMRDDRVVTPVLVLTARDDVSDRVEGLDAGADDYLRKPFAIAELLARIRALQRRGPHLVEREIHLGPIVVRLSSRQVQVDGREVPLTGREFAILVILLRRRGHVVPRSDILRDAWESPGPASEASMEVLIARLRRKLSTGAHQDPIRTHRGHGYSIGGVDET